MTRLTVFTSSDDGVARVTPDRPGRVHPDRAKSPSPCRYLMELMPVRLVYLEPKPGFKWSNPPETTIIDKHAFAKLKMLNIQPSDLCTDQEFIRRAYLDVCGILPAARGSHEVPRQQGPDQASQADRRAA